MENQRFRNHFSSVIESIGSFLVAILIFALTQIDDLAVDIASMGVSIIPVLIGIGIFILVVGLIIAWQSWVWSKTWIVLGENAISVEKNTFTFNKNTLGIKDISNVNIEQNLFEMFVGTCKVKINTNSFSTANSTDLKIVLKKSVAEQLKQTLTKRMEQLNGNEVSAKEKKDNLKQYDIKMSAKDIILNSVYSINIVWMIVAIFSMIMVTGVIANLIGYIIGEENMETMFEENLTIGIAITVMVIFTIISVAWNFLRTYFKMYGFSVGRNRDKICIKYGLFKQVDYSIPIDKINAVIVHQTFIARLLRKYSVELVNVGMGDDKQENTFVCLYGSIERVMEVMKTVLPEFADALNDKVEKQPKSAWIIYTIGMIELFLILSIIGIVSVNLGAPTIIVMWVVSAIILLSIVTHILSFITEGINISNEYIGIREGAFAVRYSVIKLEKIQFITINKSILEDKLGIARGDVNILAMMSKNTQVLPYFKKEKVDDIYRGLMKGK